MPRKATIVTQSQAVAYQQAVEATHTARRRLGQHDWNAVLRDDYQQALLQEAEAGRALFTGLQAVLGPVMGAA